MKVYVVTSLIENTDIGAEVNVIGIRKTKQEAHILAMNTLTDFKTECDKMNIDYQLKGSNNYMELTIEEERITIEYQESEVE